MLRTLLSTANVYIYHFLFTVIQNDYRFLHFKDDDDDIILFKFVHQNYHHRYCILLCLFLTPSNSIEDFAL